MIVHTSHSSQVDLYRECSLHPNIHGSCALYKNPFTLHDCVHVYHIPSAYIHVLTSNAFLCEKSFRLIKCPEPSEANRYIMYPGPAAVVYPRLTG